MIDPITGSYYSMKWGEAIDIERGTIRYLQGEEKGEGVRIQQAVDNDQYHASKRQQLDENVSVGPSKGSRSCVRPHGFLRGPDMFFHHSQLTKVPIHS